jgi:hypothetical protein
MEQNAAAAGQTVDEDAIAEAVACRPDADK